MSFKIGKRAIVTGTIILILLALYNVLYFVIPFNREFSNGAFWITYGFTTFYFVFSAFIVFLGIKDKKIDSRVFGIPLIKLAIGSCIAELLIDAIVMGVGNWFTVPFWAVIIVEAIITAYVFIAVISRYALKEHISQVDSYKEKTNFIKELRAELGVLKNKYSSHELAKEINELYETARFTDPVSDESVETIENQITSKLETLKTQLKSGELDSSKQTIQNINDLLVERKIKVSNSH